MSIFTPLVCIRLDKYLGRRPHEIWLMDLINVQVDRQLEYTREKILHGNFVTKLPLYDVNFSIFHTQKVVIKWW